MITLDIAIAGFLLAGTGFILRVVSEMKKEVRSQAQEQSRVEKEIALLSYRVEQLEVGDSFKR